MAANGPSAESPAVAGSSSATAGPEGVQEHIGETSAPPESAPSAPPPLQKSREFWTRARTAFFSTILTKNQINLLDSGASAPPAGAPQRRLEYQPLASGSARVVPREAGGDFIAAMRPQWEHYLTEELLLFKVERQNDLLQKEQGAAAHARQNPKSAGAFSSASHREPSLFPDTKSQLKPRSSLPEPLLARASSSAVAAAATPAGRATPVKGLVRSLSVDARIRDLGVVGLGSGQDGWLVTRPDVDAKKSKLTSAGHRRLDGSSIQMASHIAALEATIPKTPLSAAAKSAQQAAQFSQRDSGIVAAAAAVEAAHTSGKRIRRLWKSIKRIVKGRSSIQKSIKVPAPEYGDLNAMVRNGGFSPEERGVCWVGLAQGEGEDSVVARAKYSELKQMTVECEMEIRRDLHRTFPDHALFREAGGSGQQALFNVTKAYAALDPEVGYCQGMEFLVAVLLMQLAEEDAFFVLVYLMYRCGMRASYLPDMEQLQVRLYQLTQLLQEALPQLQDHMEDLGIKPVMYAAPWFLTLFSTTLPLSLAFRVFDIVLAEQSGAILFKLGLVLLQVCRRQLAQCTEMEHLLDFLKAELPSQLCGLPRADLEELMAKALRVELSFEGMLRLEAEYDLLADEAAAAAYEVAAAATASEAAALAWEKSQMDLERRLLEALEAQRAAELELAMMRRLLQDTSAVTQADMVHQPATNGKMESTPIVVHRVASTGAVMEARTHERVDTTLAPGQGELVLVANARRDRGPEECATTLDLLKDVLRLRRAQSAITEELARAELVLHAGIRLDNGDPSTRSLCASTSEPCATETNTILGLVGEYDGVG